MKIPHFLASLLPTFSKDRIIEDINITQSEIVQVTHPAYAIAAPDFKSHKFTSEHLKMYLGTFERHIKGKGNFIVNIEAGWRPILENLEETKRVIEAVYNDDVAGSGSTYLKANLLQFVELCGFVSKYARKMLIYVYAAETEKYPESGTVFSDSVKAGDQDWLKANMQNFCTAWNICVTPVDKFKKAIHEIPDIVVKQESADAMSATIGDKKLDPLGMKLIPVWLSPIYHIRMMVAQWQTERYHEARAELQLLQLHKLHLEKLRAGKPDAALKQQIEYTENRIQKISTKLRDMEEDAGIRQQQGVLA